nr:MAG TPA: hypothetical protein [Caudoviricetes sp.]
MPAHPSRRANRHEKAPLQHLSAKAHATRCVRIAVDNILFARYNKYKEAHRCRFYLSL